MDLPSLTSGLGADLRVVHAARGLFAARPEVAEALLGAGFGPDDSLRLSSGTAMGKRPLGELEVDDGHLLVRIFHHGGVLRWLTRDRFGSPARPFDEWRLQRRLSAQAVATPEVVAARCVRAPLFGWRLALVTRRVEGAVDLGEMLARRRDGRLGGQSWRRLLAAAGGLVGELHRIGFEHADLTPRNLLVELDALERGEPQLWVIDLDGSRFHASFGDAARSANLARLARHLERLSREHGMVLSAADRWRFLRAYQPLRDARAELARALVGRPSGPLRRLAWGLERRLGRGRSGAERHLGRERAAP